MVLVLAFLGFLAAAWAWEEVHPIAGLVVGFLFIGGAGWKMLFGLLSLARPSSRRAFGPEGKQFIAAWEARVGEMSPSRPERTPPPGLFQRWLRDYRRTGVPAGEWLDGVAALGAPSTGSRDPVEKFHVEFSSDGTGATLFLERPSSGRHRWSWTFDDPYDPSDLWWQMRVEQEVTAIEKRLGLPLTWAQHDRPQGTGSQ